MLCQQLCVVWCVCCYGYCFVACIGEGCIYCIGCRFLEVGPVGKMNSLFTLLESEKDGVMSMMCMSLE